MSGFSNDVMYAKNADFTQSDNQNVSEANGLATNGQLWIGTTVINAGGTHVNVGEITSPDSSLTFGYSSPNITAQVNTSVVRDLHVSPFIVSASLSNGASYTTIQAAINAANIAGGGSVYVQPGSYTENLTLFANVTVIGAAGNSYTTNAGTVTITGVHTPPASGVISFSRCYLVSATDIFSSVAAGSTTIVLDSCNTNCTNGFTFNLPNWTGALGKFHCESDSTDNGVVNNTGGALIFFEQSNVGAGTGQTMVTSGFVHFNEVDLGCPLNCATGTVLDLDTVTFSNTTTFSNDTTGTIRWGTWNTGATTAISMGSSAAITIVGAIITSSANPCIAGAGAGVLKLADATFTSNKVIASTVILKSSPTFINPLLYSDQGASTTIRQNSGSFVTGSFTMTTPPSTSLVDGDLIEFVATSGVTVIQLAATQVAHIGVLSTSAAGTMTSTNVGDSVSLRYQASTNLFWATKVIGTWLMA